MINVFMIHSGKDYEMVKDVIEPYLRGTDGEDPGAYASCNILTLESGVEFTFTLAFTVDAVLELEDVDLFVDELVLAVTADVSSGSSSKIARSS